MANILTKLNVSPVDWAVRDPSFVPGDGEIWFYKNNPTYPGILIMVIGDGISDIDNIGLNLVYNEASPPDRYLVGDIYMQLKGELTPANKGYPGTWANISSNFAGQFFRVEGGNAALFGSSQGDAMQRITGVVNNGSTTGLMNGASNIASGVFSNGAARTQTLQTIAGASVDLEFDSSGSVSPNPAKTDDIETRPTNDTIVIWKRTA